MRDTLDVVLRLRHAAVAEAGRALRDASRAEADAALLVETLRETIARETEIACGLATDDAAVEAFGAWLKAARQDARAAEAAYERAEADTARARAALTTTRAGTRAAEQMLETRETERRLAEQRRAQRTLDDISHRRR